MLNTKRDLEKQKLKNLMTFIQQDSSQRKSDIRFLVYRFSVFIFVAIGLLVGSAFIDDNEVAKYLFSTSHAKTAQKAITVAEKELLSSLKQREEDIARKETLLNEEEKRLQKEKSEIVSKLNEIKQVRDEINSKLEYKVKIEKDRLDKMVKSFENMKPASAAAIFENMEVNLVVRIMENMKSKVVAEIINKMKQESATLISTNFTLLKDLGQKK